MGGEKINPYLIFDSWLRISTRMIAGWDLFIINYYLLIIVSVFLFFTGFYFIIMDLILL